MEFLAFILIILAAMAIETFVYMRFSLDRITYNCHFETDIASEGDEIILVEEISNAKLLPVPWLKSEITTSKWLEFAELQSNVTDNARFASSFFMLKSYHKIVRRWKVKCLKRGVFSIEKIVLVATDLFGTANNSIPVEVDATITVLPSPIDSEDFLPVSMHLYGDRVVRRHVVSDPFYYNGVREYSDGETGRISWTATAKQGDIMLFNNEFTSGQSIAVALNIQSRETDRGTVLNERIVENCIKTAATIFCNGAENCVPMKFMTNSVTYDSESDGNEGAGEEFCQQVLETLARLKLSEKCSFDSYINDELSKVASTDIYIVTSYVTPAMTEFAESRDGVRIFTLGGSGDDTDDVIYMGRFFSGRDKNDR